MTSLTLVVVALSAVSSQPKLLDFHSEHCGPCRQMAPVIAELERRGHSVEKIDVDRQPQMAAQFRVSSIPCLVVVVDGRETDRALGVTPVAQLENMLRTAGTSSMAVAAAGPTPGDPPISPAAAAPQRGPVRDAVASLVPGRLVPGRKGPGSGPSVRGRQPVGSTGTPRLSPADQVRPHSEPNDPIQAEAQAAAAVGQAPQMTGIESEQPLHAAVPGSDFANAPAAASNNSEWKGSTSGAPEQAISSTSGAAGDHSTPDRLLAASVRLRIQESGGFSSTGSGTIIDVRGEDALILTCGHVFRNTRGKGTVLIDMFGPGAPQGLEGEVISFDLDDNRGTDVGLISFRPGVPVTPTRLASPGTRIQPGDAVFNAGCNGGDAPTLRSSRVTSIDKYLGAPNLQVAGQPVQGRSGGGLFNARGEVIGVCNAADREDNEGLYAALPSVYKLLDNAGLAEVYRPAGDMVAAAGQNSPSALNPLPPHMPEQMPLAANPAGATETSAPQQLLPGAAPLAGPDFAPGAQPSASPFSPAEVNPVAFSAAEQQALAAVQQGGHAAEVVCIIRPVGNPQAKSDVIVLDRASPEFLQVLAHERQRQTAVPAMSAPTPANPMARASGVLEARQIDPRSAAMR